MGNEPVKIHIDPRLVTQADWDDFCSRSGLKLLGNGWFIGGGLRAGCDRATATFTGPEAVPVAVAFWLRSGGRISVTDQLQGEIDAVLREKCLAGSKRIDLRHFDWSYRLQAWVAWSDEGVVPLRILVGRVVNLGTKDGIVYEGVTIASFDGKGGQLIMTGGTFGELYRDSGAIPVLGEMIIQASEVACGYIHPSAVAA